MLAYVGRGMKGQGFLSLLTHNRNLFTGNVINVILIINGDTVAKNLPANAGDTRDTQF